MAKKSILNNKPEVILKDYRRALTEAGIAVEDLILFGSYAKGVEKQWSDLDVCVVSPDFGKDKTEEMILLKKLASPIEPMIEPHPYHPRDLADPWDPLAAEIKKYGKRIPKLSLEEQK